MPEPAAFSGNVLLDGRAVDFPIFNVNGADYVSLEALQEIFRHKDALPNAKGISFSMCKITGKHGAG